MTFAVDVNDLHKTYRLGFLGRRRVHALTGVTFQVNEGEIFGLIGPNGAGKSTCIKILLNLVWPGSGSAKLLGVDVRNAASRKNVGYVPETPAPYEHLTGREYLSLQAALAGLTGRDATAEIDRVLERVELGAHQKLQIRRYSKGMTQRAMLAGALLGHPRLVILDEPTSGLDPLGRHLVRQLIVEQRQRGASVLFCTHIISDVESLCDRVALVVGGTIRRSGKVSELTATAGRSFEVVTERVQPTAAQWPGVLRHETVGAGVLLEVKEEALQSVLARVLAEGGAVTRVHPLHLSLEQTFVETVRSSGQQVGGTLE